MARLRYVLQVDSAVRTARPTMFDQPPTSDVDGAVGKVRPTAFTTPVNFSGSLGSVVRTARPIMFITTSSLPLLLIKTVRLEQLVQCLMLWTFYYL
jgi:hypothetical protein